MITAPDDLIFDSKRNTPERFELGAVMAPGTHVHRTSTLRVYDCRHAAATTWLQAGIPLGGTARRLGHSVETLVSTVDNQWSVPGGPRLPKPRSTDRGL